MKDISSKEEFDKVLCLSKAVIYFLVEWSVEERGARNAIVKILDEAENINTPVFKTDVSYEDKPYVKQWLAKQNPEIVLRGGGEIVLVKKGSVVDFIRQVCYPGIAINTVKIHKWLELDIEDNIIT